MTYRPPTNNPKTTPLPGEISVSVRVGVLNMSVCQSQHVTGKVENKGSRFLNFEFVHPDSAGESNPKTYLYKAIFDILSNCKRGGIFRL